MREPVKSTVPADKRDRRRERTVDTEQRILDAATRLFVAGGYAATTLADVAAEAGVADRTVYVRFGRKVVLFLRVIDVAIAGDLDAVDVRGRPSFARATTADTLEERLEAVVSGSVELMQRFGPLLSAAREAEAVEPEAAEAAQAGRIYTLASVRVIWERLRADGLIGDEVDLEWVVATTGLMMAADTYHSIMRTLPWDEAAYGEWIARTWLHLATTPSPPGLSSPGG